MRFLKKLFVVGYWDIFYCEDQSSLFKRSDYVHIKSTLFEWYADPFFLKNKNELLVFCERKKISKKNGDICLFVCNKHKYIKKRLIKEEHHLSFPNIVKFGENFFVMPESSRGNELSLYHFDLNKKTITNKTILLKNVKLVDSVISKNSDNICVYSYSEEESKLFQFSLLENLELKMVRFYDDLNHTYRPAGNPVNNSFYFQNCSSFYGETVLLRKLENGIFTDVPVNEELEQIQNFCKLHGYTRFHTFNLIDGSFVFDAYKEKINLFKPLLFLWRKIHGNS